MISVEVEGMENVVRTFRELGRVGEEHLMLALEETAIESTSIMKLNAPVVTNRLRSSIHYEKPNTRSFYYRDKEGKRYSGLFSERPRGVEVIVGTNVDYAEDVNIGARDPSKREFFEKGAKRARDIIDSRIRVNWEKAIKRVQ